MGSEILLGRVESDSDINLSTWAMHQVDGLRAGPWIVFLFIAHPVLFLT